jgi:hypothetical protein
LGKEVLSEKMIIHSFAKLKTNHESIASSEGKFIGRRLNNKKSRNAVSPAFPVC